MKQKQNIFFYCLFNPLFLVFGRDKWEEDINEYNIPYYETRDPMATIESSFIVESYEHQKVREIMYSNFYYTFFFKLIKKKKHLFLLHFFYKLFLLLIKFYVKNFIDFMLEKYRLLLNFY